MTRTLPAKIKKAKKESKDASNVFTVPHGMYDILPVAQPWWQRVRKKAEELAAFYNFLRIETSLLEMEALFARMSGTEDAAVREERYRIKNRRGAFLLRKDGRIPILRAYAEHSLGRQSQPQRLFHEGPVFGAETKIGNKKYYERTEGGFEIIGGSNDAIYDAQVILVFAHFLKDLRIGGITLRVNSLGCRVCRPFYRKQLYGYYSRLEPHLCGACTTSIKQNPLRLLGCEEDSCKKLQIDAPNILDRICSGCSHHLKGVLEYLDELKIPYQLESRLVGDLDYYSRTVFTISSADFPSTPLVVGGRYDYLMETIGGRLTPAVGGSLVYDFVVEILKARDARNDVKNERRVFVIHVGDLAKRKAMWLVENLRASGMMVGEMFGKESLRAQLKGAEREGYGVALIVGQREIYEDSVIVRNLANSIQETVPIDRVVDEIKRHLRHS